MMKNIIVTGDSRGIGAAVCAALRERGDNVTGLSRSKSSGAANHISMDLANRGSIKKAVAKIKSGSRAGIDGVVLCAGIAHREYLEPVERVAEQIQVNALGHYELFLSLHKEGVFNRSLCSVVNLISKTAFESNPLQIGYCASKAVQHMLFSGLARALGKENLLINHLIPGPVNTEMNPKEGDESEFIDPRKDPRAVVPAVLFLLDQPKTGPIDRIVDLRRR